MNRRASRLTGYLLLVAACGGGAAGDPDATGDGRDATTELDGEPSIDVTIEIDATARQQMQPRISGVNSSQLSTATMLHDGDFIEACRALGAGWVRFPTGAMGMVYDWSTGQIEDDMLAAADPYLFPMLRQLLLASQRATALRGGITLTDFAGFADALEADAHVTFNGFTDDAASAAALAQAVDGSGFVVPGWEVANEPFYFPGKFPTPGSYVQQMAPYAQAIRSASSGATVTAYFAGNYPAGGLGAVPGLAAWDQTLAAVPPANRFWDGVSIHVYPIVGEATSIDADMRLLNGVLAHGVGEYFDDLLIPLIGAGTPIFITELGAASSRNPMSSSHYAGLFLAEYVVRASAHPSVRQVGVHTLYLGNSQTSGLVRAADDQEAYLGANGPLDTANLDFGFYLSAPAVSLAVVNAAINGATEVLATVATGGASVPISGYDGADVPAIHAQAYTGGGRTHLVLINKSAAPQTARIAVTGAVQPSTVTLIAAAAEDPAATNTPASSGVLAATSTGDAGWLELPAYSVVRVEW